MISSIKYETKFESLWNEFVTRSKNGVFLFHRDYMEYHADRFKDASIMFFDNSNLIAVIPANINQGILYSHGGLTFGGMITDQRMKTPLMLAIFESLKNCMRNNEITKIIYKAIPHIYHDIPAEEDLYALFRNNARLVRRDVSSTILMDKRIPFNKGRRWSIKKSRTAGLKIQRSYDFNAFMAIEEVNLREKYGVKPTHSKDEIKLLASRFPENIKLYIANKNNIMLCGIIIYEYKNVAHAQYIAANEEGKELNAADLVIEHLIEQYLRDKRYFDFGISTEKNGYYLNQGLVDYKERFGARATIYDSYEMDIE